MASISLKGNEELDQLNERAERLSQWFQQPRFKNIQRPYTAKQVASLQNSIQLQYPSQIMSVKLFDLLEKARLEKDSHATFGALDTVQAANISKYLKTIYVSGWQCSSTASTTNEPGPDFADYPADTVPNKVDQLFKGLLLQDRAQNQARFNMTPQQRQNTPKYDYLAPIVADADAGFGGVTSTMKLTKLFIQAGAAGIHIEDQRPGNKKCGHMGGKVLVSTQENVNRLVAARLQADIMNTPLVILARTDALSAKLIDSNIDKIDQPFILGVYQGQQCTYPEAGLKQIQQNFSGQSMTQMANKWQSIANKMSLKEAQQFAAENGFAFEFDWETLRSKEGFYAIRGCIELCNARAEQFLKYADLIWMETPSPSLALAKKFSEMVKKHSPEKFLGYNLSPSFNWSAFNMDDKQIRDFSFDLGKLGYAWQFITLAGFHATALKSEKLAKDFSQRRMLGYVEKVQRKEEKHNVDQLTHQKWSGANYIDAAMSLVDNQSASLATSEESTENQFKKGNKDFIQKQANEGL